MIIIWHIKYYKKFNIILKFIYVFLFSSSQELEKGKYANTDIYFYHIYINKDVLLLTDKRIAYLEHSDLFGGWKVFLKSNLKNFFLSYKIIYSKSYFVGRLDSYMARN